MWSLPAVPLPVPRILGGVNAGALGSEDLVVDFEDGRCRIVQFAADLVVEGAELVEEFTHVPGAAT